MANNPAKASNADAGVRVKRSVGRPPKDHASSEDVPNLIKKAATELFAENGFHGTGVAEIGERAGIQRGSLYYHIGSKETLLWDIFTDHVSSSLEGVTKIAARTASPTDKLTALIHHQVRFVIERRLEMVTYYRDRDVFRGERAAALQTNVDAIAAQWRQVMHDGFITGEFNSEDPVILNGILSMVNLAYQWFHEDGLDSPNDVGDILTRFALTGLGSLPIASASPGNLHLTV